jgi:hypothetical protein
MFSRKDSDSYLTKNYYILFENKIENSLFKRNNLNMH